MNCAPLRGERHPERRKAVAGNDRPSKSGLGLLGKAPSTYSPDTPSPISNVEAFPLDWKTRRARAAFRLADIIKLARDRRHRGLSVDPGNFAFALASTLGSVPAGPYGIPGRQRFLRWFGLDLEALRITIERAWLGNFSDAELETIIQSVIRYSAAHGQKLMSATATGQLLAVTSAERAEFKLTQIEAVDEPRSDRIARQKEARRKRDRERKRVQRGRLARPIYENRSLSKQKPWAEEGISRRTWERRRARDASVSTHVLFSQGDGTHLRQGVAPQKTQSEQGPARLGGANRGVGADVHSHGGKTSSTRAVKTDPLPLSGGDGKGGSASPRRPIAPSSSGVIREHVPRFLMAPVQTPSLNGGP
ncbi:hypothetical protein GOFOIKOB_2990 [Methylobacterium tardum]|uniref:Uncharacterized protein n=1 Tax=Methylobacterium tardum TaxID=374432 RepID=A0AA37TIG6_9HYPH|nr:hypothetical protein GOFOIKOB_2990 [Methylobacterium tardum]GLS70156.1 hypothetical protein GCM10007890_21690 [Methylobacterium tardum]